MHDLRSFRDAMGRFPTGVTVVTLRAPDGGPLGFTANSFTSVSLEPALVLVCVGHASNSHDRLVEAGTFAVNLLSLDQVAVASRFAAKPTDGRFDGVTWTPGPSGNPILDGSAAWFSCALEAHHTAGDHTIMVGRVDALGTVDEAESLVFYRGRFGSVGT